MINTILKVKYKFTYIFFKLITSIIVCYNLNDKKIGFMSWREFSFRYGKILAFQTIAATMFVSFVIIVDSGANEAWKTHNRGVYYKYHIIFKDIILIIIEKF